MDVATLSTFVPGSIDERNRLAKQISSLDDKALLELLQITHENRNTPEGRIAFVEAISEFARRNPKDAMSWFTPEDMTPREVGWNEVAFILSTTSPAILEKWLLEDLGRASKNVQVGCFIWGLGCLSGSNAATAFELSKAIPEHLVPKTEIINAIFLSFGEQSPEDAERAARQHFTGSDLDHALYCVSISYGGTSSDPAKAIQLATTITDPSLKGQAISGQLQRWLNSDKDAAIEKLRELNSKDLQAVLQASPGNPQSLIDKLGDNHPGELIDLLSTVTPSSSTGKIYEAAVAALTINHPTQATALINSMFDGEMKGRMVSSFFFKLASEDLSAAILRVSDFNEDSLKNRAFQSLGEVAGARGLEVSLSLTESLPEVGRKSFMLAALPHSINQDPRKVAELLSEGRFPDGVESDEGVLLRVGERLSGMDPKYAKAWMDQLPQESRPNAMKGIAIEMAKNDIMELADTLSSMPRDATWKAGVEIMVKNLRTADPEMADKWQALIATPSE